MGGEHRSEKWQLDIYEAFLTIKIVVYQSWSSNKNSFSPDGDFLRLLTFMSVCLLPAEISNSLLLNFENFDPRTIFLTCSLLIFNEPKRPVLIAIFRSFVFFLLVFRSCFDKYVRHTSFINTNLLSRAPNDSSAVPGDNNHLMQRK